MSNNIPNPGSDEAIAIGCNCPVLDNNHGDPELGRIRGFVYRSDCPVHGAKMDSERETLPNIESPEQNQAQSPAQTPEESLKNQENALCPFCKSANLRVNYPAPFWIECKNCDASSPVAWTLEECWQKWNTRPLEMEKDAIIEWLEDEL